MTNRTRRLARTARRQLLVEDHPHHLVEGDAAETWAWVDTPGPPAPMPAETPDKDTTSDLLKRLQARHQRSNAKRAAVHKAAGHHHGKPAPRPNGRGRR